ncbi:enoyl-CoA hydratase [Pararhizobium mangrovi]|uniref:enoyl-CoA hydratase n=1 Tax=Pararhizobium mangrovi TaxID=2590452 RepID=A0A506TZE3_9HYPH|nr:enoyl-CoA hydratase [Pararhizobium mangrovi]TPW26095.1 enoyl-CoA hydratase [Pararhizobium mangrovi]
MAYETLKVETRGRVGLVTLDRPEAMNALNRTVMHELTAALAAFDEDAKIGAVVLTGSQKAFAAGADVKEMRDLEFVDVVLADYIAGWQQIAATRKPLVAAVAGYALGGGCEVAMMCDFIIAAENARFGQPEITLGIMPGMGGTQRLIRAVGKAKAMDLCLTGRMMDAEEAERSGLVARIVGADDLIEEAVKAAGRIAEQSMPATLLAKEAVNRAFEVSLEEGLLFERRAFQSLFATEDQKEGMAAFAEKREAQFKHR